MENISIVLPCYNHGKYVAEAIESVLKQTYKDFVLYVFDNGSTDDSWEVINSFADPRVIKIRLEENDILQVKGRFIDLAKGKYLAIMHADDLWLEEKLEKQIAFFEATPYARVCLTWSKHIEIDDVGQELEAFTKCYCPKNAPEEEWYRRLFLEENWISLPSLLCDRAIYVKYFGRLYPYRQVADVYTWLKMLEETNIYEVEEILVIQRQHKSVQGMNESYPTIVNLARGDIEARYAKYQIVDRMPDELFLKRFCKDVALDGANGHLDVMCRKFLFLAKDKQGLIHGYENAIRYYDTYFDYEEDGLVFYQYLAEKYGFDRNDFFEFEEYAGSKTLVKDSIINRWYILENMEASTLAYPDRPITIYGCGKVGKIFYRRIKPYCQVAQFIDRNPLMKDFLGVPMVSLDDAKLDKESFIIVVPSYDFEWISKNLRKKYDFLQEENIVSIEAFMKTGDIVDPTF